MNFFASLLGAAISQAVAKAALKPLTKMTSWGLRQAEGTEHGKAAAQALAPQVAGMAQEVGDAAAAKAAPVISQAVSKTRL